MKDPEPLPKLRLLPIGPLESRPPTEWEKRLREIEQLEELPPVPLAPLRVGSVPYLNAVPLTRGLEDQIVFAPPSELAKLLRDGTLDAALVSVTEALLHEGYDILDGIAVASLGEVKSVFLAHREPLEKITQIFCDTASLTSVNLLRVLLAERGLRPDFVPLPNYHDAPFYPAVLLIGDPALDFVRESHPHQIWDLGAAWFELTQLPFVYAVWALRRGHVSAALRGQLREAKSAGLRELDAIVGERKEYDYNFRKDYLGWVIHYHLGPDEKRGLAKFVELLRKHVTNNVFDPQYVE
ncbi:chorismate dehydratase [Verrucomicrobiota bacterium]|nr:chorismate dehydratase [Verrucomicrobiota bacterium]